jgi:hypothetical protein
MFAFANEAQKNQHNEASRVFRHALSGFGLDLHSKLFTPSLHWER